MVVKDIGLNFAEEIQPIFSVIPRGSLSERKLSFLIV